MAWLRRFGRRNPKPVIGKPPTEPAQVGSSSFNGEVKHCKWQRIPGGGNGTINEDFFVNPDTSSPIAGVLFDRTVIDNQAVSLGIEVVFHDGRFEEGNSKVKDCGIGTGMYMRPNSEVLWHLSSAGISPASHTQALMVNMNGSVAEVKDALAQRGQKIIQTFLDTDLLSANPEIRKAMVEKIGTVMHSVRAQIADNDPPSITGRS